MLAITTREFPGKIISGEDDDNRGRYMVHIPELMYAIIGTEDDDGSNGISCVNHVHKWRDTYLDEDDEEGKKPIGGSYYPLKEGMHVIVKFFSEDFRSGYIDRIVSDYYSDSMPLKIKTSERDEFYQIIRTSQNDLIAICINTTSLPKESIHIYHKKNKVQIICDSEGLHIEVKDKLQMKVEDIICIKSEKECHIDAQKINLNCQKCDECKDAEKITMDG